jgi:hypothetical protein
MRKDVASSAPPPTRTRDKDVAGAKLTEVEKKDDEDDFSPKGRIMTVM